MTTENALAEFFRAVNAGDDDRAEQLASALDLGDMGELQTQLAAPSPDVRWWAVRALAAIAPNSPAIIPMVNDADSTVRACAALALTRTVYESATQTQAVVDALTPHLVEAESGVGDLCALALAHLGPVASPALVRVLEQSDVAVRIRAARAMVGAATTDAIPALIRALEDDSTLVQYYAEEALERLGVGMVFFAP